jgi:hypothetical protein
MAASAGDPASAFLDEHCGQLHLAHIWGTSRGTCLISFPLLKPSSADGAERSGNDRMKIACTKRRGRNHVAWSE